MYSHYLVVALGVVCPAEEGFPETPAGEFGYSLCDDGEYGIQDCLLPRVCGSRVHQDGQHLHPQPQAEVPSFRIQYDEVGV